MAGLLPRERQRSGRSHSLKAVARKVIILFFFSQLSFVEHILQVLSILVFFRRVALQRPKALFKPWLFKTPGDETVLFTNSTAEKHIDLNELKLFLLKTMSCDGICLKVAVKPEPAAFHLLTPFSSTCSTDDGKGTVSLLFTSQHYINN